MALFSRLRAFCRLRFGASPSPTDGAVPRTCYDGMARHLLAYCDSSSSHLAGHNRKTLSAHLCLGVCVYSMKNFFATTR